MKIKSNFYDFYDFVGDSDLADEPVFERYWLKKKPRFDELFIPIEMRSIEAFFRWNKSTQGEQIVEKKCVVGYRPILIRNKLVYGIHYFVVGFCGKFYPIAIIDHVHGAYPDKRDDYSIILDINQLDLIYPENKHENYKTDWVATHLWTWFEHFDKSSEADKWGFNSRHNKAIELLNSLYDKLYKPIFLIEIDENGLPILEPNPNLRDYNFVKLIDPYIAYQEINMFLGSMLTSPERPIITISDNDKIQQHGFDKFSFKTMKGDKKPRSKNRAKNKLN